jgi:methionyl-tRNA synthetase
VRPKEITDEYGVDAYRYYFMREFSFGVDGNFSRRTILKRYNAELANDLGNLESRVLTMVHKYRGGVVPAPGAPSVEEDVLSERAAALVDSLDAKLGNLSFNEALAEVWEFVHAVNRYVDVSAPWSLAKDETRKSDLDRVLYNSLEGLRQIALFIAPFMPGTAEKIWERLGLGDFSSVRLPESAAWGGLPAGAATTRGEGLFPRKMDSQAEGS